MKTLLSIFLVAVLTMNLSGQTMTIHLKDGRNADYMIKDIDRITYSSSEATMNPNILTDPRDDNRYKTVKIGNQIWMSENINYNAGAGSWCYENNSSNCAKYGRLYTWNTAQNACPTGWHLPSDEEWSILIESVDHYANPNSNPESEIAGGKLKEIGLVHWTTPNTGAIDEKGFKALPGGDRKPSGSFDDLGLNGLWWSSTENNNSYGWSRVIAWDKSSLWRRTDSKNWGISVRCIKD
jgi:uncharacterized protein (TIGR02145 family)